MAKQFILALLIVVVAGGGYFLWQSQTVPAPEVETEKVTDVFGPPAGSVMEDGVLPEDSEDESEAEDTPSSGDTTGGTSGGTSEGTSGSTTDSFTMAQVGMHNSKSSCWSVIDNNVYDLTTWIGQHPGGQQAILGLCGKDGTAAFHGQHDDAKKQADILATFKIGVLAR